MTHPKLSIVTVTKNNAQGLKLTDSIASQNLHVELIIVDSLSNDNTHSVISGYSAIITKYIYESDSSIYDGMNKGIANATGDWIIFLNAGDYFFSSNVLSLIDFDSPAECIYFDTNIIYNHSFSMVHRALATFEWDNVTQIPFCHQSVICKRCLFDSNLFDDSYSFLADFVWFSSTRPLCMYLPLILSSVDYNGVSRRFSISFIKEKRRAMMHFGQYSYYFFLLWLIRYCFSAALRSFLPLMIQNAYYSLKYKS